MKLVASSGCPCRGASGFVLLAASLILAACGSGLPALPEPSPTAQPATATRTFSLPSTDIAPGEQSPTSTATPVPCDPSRVDYCLEDAFFIFHPPIAPPGTDRIDRGYPYGSTQGGTRVPHHGVEFYNGSGTPVLAATAGTVYFAADDATRKFSPWFGFYGNIVVLQHPLSVSPFKSLYTLYAHLSKIDVSAGQSVSAGEKIGEVGLTGTATGSHLHFEVRVDPNDYASTLNPELWLVPHPGNGTLALGAVDQSGAPIFTAFDVQSYPDRNLPATAAFQVEAYNPETVNSRDPWGEIAALGDQPAGLYRVTLIWEAVLYEKWVEIQPGRLTRVIFMVK
jgi:murein DD-endopeptidase MepM/ murein hydrolase activator NlpD